MIFAILILEYVIFAVMSYIFLNAMDLKFTQKNKIVVLTERQKKIFLMIMSVLWIIYIPKLYFDSRKEN